MIHGECNLVLSSGMSEVSPNPLESLQSTYGVTRFGLKAFEIKMRESGILHAPITYGVEQCILQFRLGSSVCCFSLLPKISSASVLFFALSSLFNSAASLPCFVIHSYSPSSIFAIFFCPHSPILVWCVLKILLICSDIHDKSAFSNPGSGLLRTIGPDRPFK